MHEPDDFGLSPFQTLAHVGEPTPAPGHGPFWNRFADDFWKHEPALREATAEERSACGARGVTHVLESLGRVRIGCRLTGDPGKARWGLVTLHGYEPDGALSESDSQDDARVTLEVRLRGFRGSWLDTGDWRTAPGGWIAQGVEGPTTWSLRGAVADALSAVRALRRLLATDAPISMRGVSFGAGVGVIAAAQLGGRDRLHRLAIALPSLGDWTWRLARPCPAGGAGLWAESEKLMRERPQEAPAIRELLRICDSAVHAPKAACPTLCLLATRDEIVPAPSAAAVYNALGASPGRKWRFVVRCGHAACGRDDLRRYALFERLAVEFLDPANDPAALMRQRSDTLSPAPAPARASGYTPP